MGLTKQYLRYVPSGTFNIIASSGCNVCFVVLQGQEGRFLAAGACENVIIWDLRLGEKATVLCGENSEVTQVCASPDRVHLAAGYSNGSINIFNLLTTEIITVFSGHRTAISTLAFDFPGHRLASGGKDTEIVLWDMVSQSGLDRLSGHKGVITGVAFMKHKNILISSSKDTLIKLWDLDVTFCFHTIAAHVTEVWGIAITGNDAYIVAGTNDSELRVWALLPSEVSEENSTHINAGITCQYSGSVLRAGRGRVVSMTTDSEKGILSVHGADSSVETFLFHKPESIETRLKKRQAKERKKATKEGVEYVKSDMSLKDVVQRLPVIKASSKVKSVSITRGKDEVRVGVSLNNNKIELYSVMVSESHKKDGPNRLRRVENNGHQGEVRAVAISSDNLAVASVGTHSIKMWNRVSLECLRTVEAVQCISVCFVPGDRHALVGTKAGTLLIVDLTAGIILETIEAHSAELWAITLTSDKACAVTCSADTTVKIWRFELVKTDESKSKVLSVLHLRTLKLEDAAFSVKVSPCGKYIAVALLDSTVKIFFMDTFKFFLSLFGHKFPVLCCDISYDSSLIVTGSADRNIKIWGMDFGDCHKSLFAHDDSVTGIAFVPNTHYFFSIGKDGKVKQWDADSFEKIITLQGHFGEGWGLAVSGEYVVSCGADRVVRLYWRSEEPLVLSDEQEEERALEELATGQDSTVVLPSTKTVSAERGAEALMECLQVMNTFKEELESGIKPTIPAIMVAYKAKTPEDYLAKILGSIRSSDLGEALILLPLLSVVNLLGFLPKLLAVPNTCELAARTMLLLIKVHRGPLSVDTSNYSLFSKLQEVATKSIEQFRDTLGYNLHALAFIKSEIEEREGVQFFKDATIARKEKEKKNKQRLKQIKQVAFTT